jgi:hypothetical protein
LSILLLSLLLLLGLLRELALQLVVVVVAIHGGSIWPYRRAAGVESRQRPVALCLSAEVPGLLPD